MNGSERTFAARQLTRLVHSCKPCYSRMMTEIVVCNAAEVLVNCNPQHVNLREM